MDDSAKIPKEFIDRYKHISSEIKALAKDFGLCEYSLIFTKYASNGQYQWGKHDHRILHENNLDIYREMLTGLKTTIQERTRFSHVANLKEFRVICRNDDMSQELSNLQIKNGGDWVTRGEEYTVIKSKNAISELGGFTFFLKDKNDIYISPPYPFEGFHSSRFEVIDYTKLN